MNSNIPAFKTKIEHGVVVINDISFEDDPRTNMLNIETELSMKLQGKAIVYQDADAYWTVVNYRDNHIDILYGCANKSVAMAMANKKAEQETTKNKENPHA